MSKKTTDQTTEKQAAKKQPAELKDEQLDKVQGGRSRGERMVQVLDRPRRGRAERVARGSRANLSTEVR